MSDAVELLQFRFSPYNEKARWALDYKKVPHKRTSLAPGPHVPNIRALTGQTAQEAFDWVAKETKLTGYLVGGKFTMADLTVASHLAACIDPPHVDMQRPQPAPQKMNDWLARWRAHPGASWVMEMYRKHRPQPLAK